MRKSEKSRVLRIPSSDYLDIKKIQDEYNITIGAAFQIWKKKQFDMKWKNI